MIKIPMSIKKSNLSHKILFTIELSFLIGFPVNLILVYCRAAYSIFLKYLSRCIVKKVHSHHSIMMVAVL